MRASRAATKPPYEGGANLLSANQGVDLGVFRKPAELLFGEFELSVDGDFENPSDSFDELHLLRTAFDEPRPRTEGPWFIVSRHAIFDSDLHSRHLRGEGNVSSYHLPAPIAIIARDRKIRCAYPHAGFRIICPFMLSSPRRLPRMTPVGGSPNSPAPSAG